MRFYNSIRRRKITEDFSDQLPEWAKEAIRGQQYNKSLKKLLMQNSIDPANVRVTSIDPDDLSSGMIKNGVDDQGNIVILYLRFRGQRFVYIPTVFGESTPVYNQRTGKYQAIKNFPAKDIRDHVEDAILLTPSEDLYNLRQSRKLSKEGALERRLPGDEFTRDRYARDKNKYDKSGYRIPDISDLFIKLTKLTPYNYEERFAYADKKLEDVKKSIIKLMEDPNLKANLFASQTGSLLRDNKLKTLSYIVDSVIDASRDLDNIKQFVDEIVTRGENVDERFDYINTGFKDLLGFRKDIMKINSKIKDFSKDLTLEASNIAESLKRKRF